MKSNNPCKVNRREAVSLVAALTEALQQNDKVQLIMSPMGEVVSIPLLNGEICAAGIYLDL
jgi:hypothetical protein